MFTLTKLRGYPLARLFSTFESASSPSDEEFIKKTTNDLSSIFKSPKLTLADADII